MEVAGQCIPLISALHPNQPELERRESDRGGYYYSIRFDRPLFPSLMFPSLRSTRSQHSIQLLGTTLHFREKLRGTKYMILCSECESHTNISQYRCYNQLNLVSKPLELSRRLFEQRGRPLLQQLNLLNVCAVGCFGGTPPILMNWSRDHMWGPPVEARSLYKRPFRYVDPSHVGGDRFADGFLGRRAWQPFKMVRGEIGLKVKLALNIFRIWNAGPTYNLRLIVGSVDQFVDSTDVLSSAHAIPESEI